MQGPTLTMSLNDPLAFPRSRSSPNITDLVNFDFDLKEPAARVEDGLPRSASFNCLPTLESQYPRENILERSVSTDVSPETQEKRVVDTGDVKIPKKLSKEERPKLDRVGRRRSLVARPKSWIQNLKGSSERQNSSESVHTTPVNAPPVPTISKDIRDNKTKSVSETFATFARKSWISSSRDPSPSNRIKKKEKKEKYTEDNLSPDGRIAGTSSARSVSPAKNTKEPAQVVENELKPVTRPPTTLQKIRQRPQSVLMSFTNLASANSSTSSLPSSSVDNRSTSTPRTSTERIPPIPKKTSADRIGIGMEIPRRRDELWSAFRSLENDYAKFQSKSWSLKTNVVRASLLPFLRSHASHPSNKTLRAEDLDRRVHILNKWWSGLLEVLDGRQNQTVSGVDRPILLDACYAIMTRSEWRLYPSVFAPLAERSPNRVSDYASERASDRRSLPRKKSSSASLSSSASQFMAESVYHNTRNLFIQNLLAQMSFVVEKMSMRHAPASLVTFCGKAAAYAFFFVPGVAEMLVRIWKLQADVLRRISDELNMPRRPNKVEIDEVIAAFPAHMHCLGWTSVKQLSAQLRQDPHTPVMAAKIAWNGPWVARWCGRDSDLFFVFAKYFHILAEEFLPSELSVVEKARAPGFMLVQAQLLTALDATIHRQPAAEPLPITFDDVLAGADATATLPLPSTNSTRLMAENRLIMLLRDFISERPSDFENARLTFAETFSKIIQAGAKRTSVFDHHACFVMCDFMEEALSIYIRFHHAHALESDFIDWRFWLDVCKKMLDSQNSMSEIRLFALLYGAWNVITGDERRKEAICLEWLLKDEMFDKFFNHWCPMVRAYYMRLLCWRLCRDDGEATDLDIKIFATASILIKSNWGHYVFLKQFADKNDLLPPSTAPCHPAPGRRLLIIRNDNHNTASGLFLGFDGILGQPGHQSQGSSQPTAYKRHSSLASLTKSDTSDSLASNTKIAEASTSPAPNKKRWTFMGKLLPSASTSSESTSSDSRGSSPPPKTLEEARKETALARTNPKQHSKSSSTDSETPPASSASPAYRTFCFKFSLEWTQHFEKPGIGPPNGNHRIGGVVGFNMGAERRLMAPRLPSAAQGSLGARVPNMNREVRPVDPKLFGIEKATRSKYSGRALAEWALVVAECNNFSDRRRAEGVPSLRWVEVPTLGVEGFRKFG